MRGRRIVPVLLVIAALLGASWSAGRAQQHTAPGHAAPPAPARGQTHGDHGTPPDWKFTWPKGDPIRGREVFLKLQCYSCHEVRGESFPAPSEREKVGPELSVMGPLHEAEYFAESIINPSAVIERGKGYAAPDGSSKMPSYNDSVTVQEVVDLVAYLRSLKAAVGASPPQGGHGGHSQP